MNVDQRSRLKAYLSSGTCPDLLSFAMNALQREPTLARLLMDEVILRMLTDARILTREDAFTLGEAAQRFDRTLDSRLLEFVRSQYESQTGAREENVLRGLDVLEHIGPTTRSIMTLVRLSTDRQPRVHSKALKLLGSIKMSTSWIQKALDDMDPRGRANLLDGLLRQPDPLSDKVLIDLVRTAARDPHHRVATTALCLLVRTGDYQSLEELKKLMKHREESWRRAAEWALGVIRKHGWAYLGFEPGGMPIRASL
jgi:hypothetical protein